MGQTKSAGRIFWRLLVRMKHNDAFDTDQGPGSCQ